MHWELWRQDDHGNEFLMRAFDDRATAEAARDKYAGRGHHQHYWVKAPARLSDTAATRHVTPDEGAAILPGMGAPWWVAGGWAIDLFIGAQTRPHGDLDVAMLLIRIGSTRISRGGICASCRSSTSCNVGMAVGWSCPCTTYGRVALGAQRGLDARGPPQRARRRRICLSARSRC